MTTHRLQGVKRLAVLAGATIVLGWFVTAPMAYAGIGDEIGGIGDTVGGATSSTTDTVTGTVDSTTDTVDSTVGSTTDTVTDAVDSTTETANNTVNDPIGSTTETVNDNSGSTTETVNNPVGSTTDTVSGTTDGTVGGTDTVTDTVGGVVGTSTTTSGGGGSGSGSGSHSGTNSTSKSPGATGETRTITLPDGSTIEVPVLTGGTIDGHKIFTSNTDTQLSPDAAALRGMLAGFVTSGSDSDSVELDGESAGSTPGSSFLDNASRAAAQAAKKLAFPMTLVVIVGIFVLGHGRIGRKDPKLILAPVDDEEETLTFR